MEKYRIPIGIDDFQELRSKNYYYVDKTLFAHELLESGGKVSLFTRPRRFGKTLNMTPLLMLFIQVDFTTKYTVLLVPYMLLH